MSERESVSSAADFYDALGDSYDEMTSFAKRLETVRPVVQQLVERLQIRSALDVGCGSGLHAVLLAQSGTTVTAIDPSPEMIRLAHAHAEQMRVAVNFRTATARELISQTASEFDTILCLGNTLPHILTEEELVSNLQAMHTMLKPGGTLLLQLLNYDRILAKRERIVGIRRAGERTYVRFYDFADPRLYFNILTIDTSSSCASHELVTTELYPWRSHELGDQLNSAGFEQVTQYGGLKLSPFDAEKSTDLVLLARPGSGSA